MLLVTAWVVTAGLAAPAHAEAPLVVVVEAEQGGAHVGEKVRAELSAQLDTPVLWAEATGAIRSLPVLLIAAGKPRQGELSIWYWDVMGTSDVLTIPWSGTADALAPTITTLSMALIGRNLPKPRICLDADSPDLSCSRAAELRWGVRMLELLGKPSPRGVRLSLADFED